MPFDMQRRVTRRLILKFGAAAGTAVTGWVAGLVPEIVAAQSANSGPTDDGRELSADEVRAHLSTLHSPQADRFVARLGSMGHMQQRAATSGATRTIEGQVYVLLELAFSKVGTTGALIYVLKKNSVIDSVSAVRFAPTGRGGTRVEELVTGTDGVVRIGRSATMDADRTFHLFELDGTVKTATLAEIQTAARKGTPSGGATALPVGVIRAEADGWNCTTCNLAGSFVAAFGCGIGAFLASLLCGPGAPVCALLVVIIAGGWCWSVFTLGTLFTCCRMGYCNWCRDCAVC
jgi:hypothetical protein